MVALWLQTVLSRVSTVPNWGQRKTMLNTQWPFRHSSQLYQTCLSSSARFLSWQTRGQWQRLQHIYGHHICTWQSLFFLVCQLPGQSPKPGRDFPTVTVIQACFVCRVVVVRGRAALGEPLALSARVTKRSLSAAERGPTPAARAPCSAQLSARQRQTAGLGRSYLVLLSGISKIIKLAVCPWTATSVPHKRYLVLPGNFYGWSHKQTKSIAANFFFSFLTRAAPFETTKKHTEKMYPEPHPPNKQEEHIFASYILKLLRWRFWF